MSWSLEKKIKNELRLIIMKRQSDRKIRISFLTLVLIITTVTSSFSQKGMTLEQALIIAESNSPTIKKTKLNLIRNQENLNAQNAALKSNFSLSVNPISYSQNRAFNNSISSFNTTKDLQSSGSFSIVQPIIFTDATITLSDNFSYYNNIYNEQFKTAGITYNNDLSIKLNQPLFTYNRTKLTLKELQLSLENAQLNYAIQLLSMEKNVSQAFYAVYQGQQSLDIADQAYVNMQKSYEISKNKVNAGISAQSEMFQAELNLATTRSDFENKQVAFENAKDNFKNLVGMNLYDDILVIPNISVDTVKIDISFAIDQGLANRMELRQRQISIETSQFDLIQTKALNEFKGNLGLSFGINGNNEKLKDIYSDPKNNENVSLSFQIPLWDWGEKKSRIKASEATIQSSNIDLEVERNNIILSIRQSYRNLNNLQNQIEIARQNVTNAQLTYDLNLEKYKNGDLTGMDLNIYQNQLSEKKLSYTNSLISYKLELLNLKIQVLYDFEKKQPVSPVMTLDNKKI
jgi:outer membrane protein